MKLEINKIVRKLFEEVISKEDLAVADELLAEDVVFRGRGGRVRAHAALALSNIGF